MGKCKFLTEKEILTSNKSRIIEKSKFTYSYLDKTFQKQIKATVDQDHKVQAFKAFKEEKNQELKSVEGLFPKRMRNNKTKNEIDEIKKWAEKIK